MRCGWGPYFRRTFEVQAGNSPLQGQSKPPAKLVVLIFRFCEASRNVMKIGGYVASIQQKSQQL